MAHSPPRASRRREGLDASQQPLTGAHPGDRFYIIVREKVEVVLTPRGRPAGSPSRRTFLKIGRSIPTKCREAGRLGGFSRESGRAPNGGSLDRVAGHPSLLDERQAARDPGAYDRGREVAAGLVT